MHQVQHGYILVFVGMWLSLIVFGEGVKLDIMPHWLKVSQQGNTSSPIPYSELVFIMVACVLFSFTKYMDYTTLFNTIRRDIYDCIYLIRLFISCYLGSLRMLVLEAVCLVARPMVLKTGGMHSSDLIA